MLCDSCKKNEATVHSVSIINGVKQEHYLCPECANAAQFKLPGLFDVLGGFHLAHKEQPACECGQDFSVFKKTGLLGCPHCYTTYHDQLMPIIKQMQSGRVHHVGRAPETVSAATKEQPLATAPKTNELSELEHLKLELQSAVKAEKYERAAELRDRIRLLESEEHKNEC